MSCLNPITIVNPRWKKLWKLHQHAPEKIAPDVLSYLVVPCSKCLACRKKRGSSWRTRLLHETLYGGHKSAIFVTFSVSPVYYDSIVGDPARAIRLFCERYRKKYGKSCKHFFVTELGERTGRFHFHGILWNCKADFSELTSLWSYGHIWIGYVNEKTCSYVVKYITKLDLQHPDFVPSVYCSPGIGRAFTLSDSNIRHLLSFSYDQIPYIVLPSGRRASVPRYYMDRMVPESVRIGRSLFLRLSSSCIRAGDVVMQMVGKCSFPLVYGSFESLHRFQSARAAYYNRSMQLGLSII